MSYALCASFDCRESHRKTSEKVPDNPQDKTRLLSAPYVATLPTGRLSPSRRSSAVDCLAMPCPKCNKHAIVQRSPNTFDCLNCSFHKRLPPAGASYPLISPRRLDTSGLGGYELNNAGLEGSGLDGDALGQGSLARHLTRSPLYTPPSPTETTQPIIFAVIAVIIGILVL